MIMDRDWGAGTLGDLEPGDPSTVGPFRLAKRLGQGGMGIVYLAWSLGGRPVAVKVISKENAADPAFRQRFAAEIDAAMRVAGVFTVSVIAADPNGPTPWMATEYVQGPSLREAVDRHGPLSLETVRWLGAGLAEGLAMIHGLDLVHRDLKPGNVLLTAHGPRVIDFGIARALDRTSQTLAGQRLGTPAYMSPEQARGDEEAGKPSDMFSLGSVLVFAATGESPFRASDNWAIADRVIRDRPDLTAVPGEIRPLIERCLAKDPAARPDAVEVLRELSHGQFIDARGLPEAITDMIEQRVPPAAPPDLAASEAEPDNTFRAVYRESGRSRLLGKLLLVLLSTSAVMFTALSWTLMPLLNSDRKTEGLTWTDVWPGPALSEYPEFLFGPLSVIAALVCWYGLIMLLPRSLRSMRRKPTTLTLDGLGITLDGPYGRTFCAWRDIRRVTVIPAPERRWGKRPTIALDPAYEADLPTTADHGRYEPCISPVSGWVILTRIDGFRDPASKIEADLRSRAGRRFRAMLAGTEVQLLPRTPTDRRGPARTAPDVPASSRRAGVFLRYPRGIVAAAVTAVLVLVPVAEAGGDPPHPRLTATLMPLTDPDLLSTYVSSADFSPDGTLIAATFGNGVGLWDVRSRKKISVLATDVPDHLAFSPDSRLLAVSADDGVELWGARSRKLVRLLRPPGQSTVGRPSFTRDGTKVIAEATGYVQGKDTNEIIVWNVADGTAQTRSTSATEVYLSPDGVTLAAVDSSIELLDIRTWRRQGQIIQPTGTADCEQSGSQSVTSLAFSPDGKLLSSCLTGDQIIDVKTGQPTFTYVPEHTGNEASAFSHDGTTIAISDGSSLRFEDPQTGNLLYQVVRPKHVTFTGLAFSPDARTMLSYGNGLLLWSVPPRP